MCNVRINLKDIVGDREYAEGKGKAAEAELNRAKEECRRILDILDRRSS